MYFVRTAYRRTTFSADLSNATGTEAAYAVAAYGAICLAAMASAFFIATVQAMP